MPGLDLGSILNVVLMILGALFFLSALVFVASLLWGYFTAGKPKLPTLPAIASPPVSPPAATTIPATLGHYLAPLNALPEGQLLGKALLSEIQQLGVELGKSLLSGLAGKVLAPLLPPPTSPPAQAPVPAMPHTIIDNSQAVLQNQLASLQTDVATLKETLGKLSGTIKVQVDPSQLEPRG